MTRVDELVTDLKLLINEHYVLKREIEENTRLKSEIENIRAEIDNYISDFIATDIVLQIIDKHIGGKE